MYKNIEELRKAIAAAAPLTAAETQAFDLLVKIREVTSEIHNNKTLIDSNKVRRSELAKDRSTDHVKLKIEAAKLFRATGEAEAAIEILKERKAVLSGELAPLRSTIESEHEKLFNEIDRHNASVKSAYLESAEVRQAYRVLKTCAEFAGRSPEGLLYDCDFDTVTDYIPDAAKELKPSPKVERIDLVKRIDQAQCVTE